MQNPRVLLQAAELSAPVHCRQLRWNIIKPMTDVQVQVRHPSAHVLLGDHLVLPEFLQPGLEDVDLALGPPGLIEILVWRTGCCIRRRGKASNYAPGQ